MAMNDWRMVSREAETAPQGLDDRQQEADDDAAHEAGKGKITAQGGRKDQEQGSGHGSEGKG
jgi:hypothetical protein